MAKNIVIYLLSICIVGLAFSKHTASSINSVLDLDRLFPYLKDNITGQVIQPRYYMDFENIYAPNDTYKKQVSAQSRIYHLLKAFDFANYFKSDYWHYSNKHDLYVSAQPVANETKCSHQLHWLEHQLNVSDVLFKRGEQHVKLATYVDSFGRPEAKTLFGRVHWLGSYYECVRSVIDMDKLDQEACNSSVPSAEQCMELKSRHGASTSKLRARYCIGKGRDIDWPSKLEDNYVPQISYKIGLCLPEACETLSFEKHHDQIQRLMAFNLPEYMKSRIKLHEIYCLPDNKSPIRELSSSARVFLAICATWILALVLATLAFSCYKRHQNDVKNIKIAEQAHRELEMSQLTGEKLEQCQVNLAIGAKGANDALELKYINYVVCEHEANKFMCKNLLTNGTHMVLTEASEQIKSPEPPENLDQNNDLVGSHSTLSYKPSSSIVSWLSDSPITVKILQSLSIIENMLEFQEPPTMLRVPGASKRLRINLNALDSIKCLCCILVIFGHIVFIHMQHLSNFVQAIELSYELSPRMLIAFFNFVDTFFIISGMLTAYFVFKRFNKKTFANPIIWLYISMLRLLRLSPVYVLVFWFIKTLVVHLGEGPLWDYGTDKDSIQGLCMNDHWWKSILYLGNLGTMQPLCILPAWSIIVDSQYSLIVPPILFLLMRWKRLGYGLLLLAVLGSTANMSFQLANQTAVRTSDLAKVRLHVYPMISRFEAKFYNAAWNRIGPVAVGILGGHLLYLYDIGTIRRWPWFMRGMAFKMVLLLHVFIIILPTIGRFTDDPESSNQTDITMFIISNASIKPAWSLINTVLLLRLITDLRGHSVMARLMSHNIWHNAGKLCFSSYLIHYEIILLLLKSQQDGMMDVNWTNVMREFSLVFLISTILAYLIYILFEAPINKLVMLTFGKPNYSNKSKQQHLKGSLGVDECHSNNDEVAYSALREGQQIIADNKDSELEPSKDFIVLEKKFHSDK